MILKSVYVVKPKLKLYGLKSIVHVVQRLKIWHMNIQKKAAKPFISNLKSYF